jgi:hypothetical protein
MEDILVIVSGVTVHNFGEIRRYLWHGVLSPAPVFVENDYHL